MVELRDRAKDRVGGYSHGMRQRLGIAASLLRDPQLLLLDEPTTGLDPAGMRDMRELVKRLAGEGITILLSSHILAEVEELCNRVAIIRRGAIIYEGRLDELLASAGGGYRLRTTDHERARARAARAPGIDGVAARRRRAALPGRRGRARRGARSRSAAPASASPRSSPHTATLEELFLGMTGGERTTEAVAMTRVYKWELLKLLAQKRTYLGLGAAMLVPLVFVIVLIDPDRAARTTSRSGATSARPGLATPFVVLFFMSIWAFPLITALVAGDIVAAESHNGTLKTILTRSRNRGEIYAGKVLATFTYTARRPLRDGRRRACRGEHRVGLQPADVALGHDGQPRGTGSACSPRASRVYAWPMAGDRRVRADALDRSPATAPRRSSGR